MRAIAPALGACLLAALLGASTPHAADPQPYAVTITPTGNAAINSAVHDAATLVSLRDTAAVGPFALLARARSDRDRFGEVLHSFGYYAASIAITIDGRPLDNSDLPAALDQADSHPVPITVAITPGALFHLGAVTLNGEVPADARAALALSPGQPAVAADVVAARDRLLASLRASGHALAKVSDPAATLHPDTHTLDIAIQVDAGPRVALGPITIEGLGRMHESFVRRRLLLHQGESFSPAAIEAARADLAGIGPFSSVRINTASALDAAGQLPVQIRVTERKLRSLTLGAAYSTDLGGSVTAGWTHRDLFGNAEQLALNAAITNLGGSDSRQPGYNLSALLTLPDWQHRDQSLIFNLSAIDQWLEAYTTREEEGGVTVQRKLNPELTASVGIEAIQAHIEQEEIGRDYTLLQLPLALHYDTTHASLDPTHGVRGNLLVTPTEDFGGSAFVIAEASGSVYFDLGATLGATPGRSVLAGRALVGTVQGASTFEIPPDQRFYAGGGGSVRGFRFQSIGPQFTDGNPTGGTGVDVGSVEFRQRIGADYGAVAFVDAGQVASNGEPFGGVVRVGAGIGARYYTSFGPIRLDVAVPVGAHPGSDSFELYLGIGQAF